MEEVEELGDSIRKTTSVDIEITNDYHQECFWKSTESYCFQTLLTESGALTKGRISEI